MPYPDQKDYIRFLFLLIEEFELHDPPPQRPGRPYSYKNRSLICFFATMQLKRCTSFKAMHRWLLNHKQEAQLLGFHTIPTRRTLSRRYKVLYEVIKQFVRFISGWRIPD